MVRQDLVYGLKNAIERGASLEQAKQSFLSSGYSREEVEEAALFVYSEVPGLSSGSSIIEKQESEFSSIPSPVIQEAILPGIGAKSESFFSKIKEYWKIAMLVGILGLLLIILIITIVFKDKIIAIFS